MVEKELKGRWRIVEMDQWDKEFIDNSFGSFHFGCIYANIDYCIDDHVKAEFSFYGDDEGQEVFGRGWAKVDNKGLYGGLFFHEGDESEFQAAKETSTKRQNIHFKRKNKRNSSMTKLNILA